MNVNIGILQAAMWEESSFLASTNIDNGFEYYWKIVVEESGSL